MNNCFLLGERIDYVYKEFVDDIDYIMDNILDNTIKSLDKIKEHDDFCDKYIPGYASYKQHSISFIVLKKTYYYLKETNTNLDLKSAAIAAVKRADNDKTKRIWNHATWQMKVNLIYDMRIGGSGYSGSTEETKEEAVISVLKSARHAKEFSKIVKGLAQPINSGRDKVKVDDLVDRGEQDRFNKLKVEYNFKE